MPALEYHIIWEEAVGRRTWILKWIQIKGLNHTLWVRSSLHINQEWYHQRVISATGLTLEISLQKLKTKIEQIPAGRIR